jgi:hypothetical protein
MKRLKKYSVPTLVFSAWVLLFSCNADKLELTNPNELLPQTYFTTPIQVESAVNSIYGSLQTTGMYNRGMWYGNDNMAHENTCNPQQEADKRQWLNFDFDETHGLIEAYWNSCYRGINKANFVINNAQKINEVIPLSEMSQELKDKFLGEAQFMRALYYFFLVTKFGDVPIYLGVDQIAEAVGVERKPASEVWALIEADCIEAAGNLLDKSVEEKGRATIGAAWALLGKARLYQGKYQLALDAFNNITGYNLEPVYFDNFKEETENGQESLFEVQFNIAAGYGNQWASDRTDAGKNEATFRGQEYGCKNWFNVFPSQDLWNEFETAADNGVKTDPRRGYCIYQNGDLYNNNTMSMVIDSAIVYAPDGVTVLDHYQRRGWKKYQNYYKAATEGAVAGNESGINMKVIRYADVILMKAECQANLNDIPGAVITMNLVRQRADVDLPLYGTAGAMNDHYPVDNLANFMKALEHERKIELCGEQVRFCDLVRWGRLADFILLESKPTTPKADQANLAFTAPRNYLWPIPLKEIAVNENISPEQQNPGY